ncbi:DNA damage-inducible protein 1 [Entomophthora muscae]|uniref:DNA damage-inducible protein 1 n=1 Tax=Entomophthora muscae TaxID=34485 RepID=A0ACC2UDA2_9FUNG|nr:DNA damage-inducible protein 1 [Entomophthora muscae]
MAQVQETCLASKLSIASDLPSLKGVPFSPPIEIIEANFSEIDQSLKQYFNTLAPLSVHVLNLHSELYSECTYTDISVNKVKVHAIIDSGTPINIVSTHLVRKLGIAPDLPNTRVYGTARKHTTTSEIAYSALLMRLGSIAVFSPVVVLPSKNYDVLIGTAFLRKYGVRLNMKDNTLTILCQTIPLYYTQHSTELTHSASQLTECQQIFNIQ